MDYNLACYGHYTNCFRCLIKCPDREKCEGATSIRYVEKELNKKEKNENEEGKNK